MLHRIMKFIEYKTIALLSITLLMLNVSCSIDTTGEHLVMTSEASTSESEIVQTEMTTTESVSTTIPSLASGIEESSMSAELIAWRDSLSENQISEIVSNADKILNNTIPYNLSGTRKEAVYTGIFEDFYDLLRSEQRLIYNFDFLDNMTNAYIISQNDEYIEKGVSLLSDFDEQEEFDTTKMSWHDETTAGRLSNIVQFYTRTEKAGYAFSEAEKSLMQGHCEIIAQKIAYTDFYSGNNNHGFYQDKAILDYGILFEDNEIAAIGATRYQNYLLNSFTEEGVHKENSPEYHFHIVEELKYGIEKYNEDVLPRYDMLLDLYVNTLYYSNMVILPNGLLPNIGDTKSMNINLAKYYDEEMLEYYTVDERATFVDSGYDVYKSESNYLIFKASYLSNYHHHDDDLSFWLYKDGNIFTEFGSYGYEYSHPHSQYQASFEAHNTLVVDGENTTNGSLDVGILDSSTNEKTMSGQTNRIEKVEFKRNIIFDDDLSNISVNNYVDWY